MITGAVLRIFLWAILDASYSYEFALSWALVVDLVLQKARSSCVLFCFLLDPSFLSSKCTSERVFWIQFSGYPLSRRCVLKCSILSSTNVLDELVLRSLRASPLIKPLYSRWVAREKVRVLKSFSWLEVSADIKYWLNKESLAFLNSSIHENGLCFRYVSRKLYSGVVIVSLFNGLCYALLVTVPEGDYIVDLLLKISVSTFAMQILTKTTSIFVPMAVPCVWR